MIDAPVQGSGRGLSRPDEWHGRGDARQSSGSAGLVRENRLTGFAVTRPSAAVPNVPTFDSLGVKNFEDVFWYGVVAPPGLPPEIAERVQKILAQALLADPGRGKMRGARRRACRLDAGRLQRDHGPRNAAVARPGRSPRHQARIGARS